MFKELMSVLKSLSVADKYLLGVSLALLINTDLAIFIAILVIAFFVYRIVKEVSVKLDTVS